MSQTTRQWLKVLLCILICFPSPSFAASYNLSFVVQPSDIIVGGNVFATTVLTHPTRSLIASNAVQFSIHDQNDRPVAGTSVLPVTTDSRGLAVYADTILVPGRGYFMVASCQSAVIRSKPFDVLPDPSASVSAVQELPPPTAEGPPAQDTAPIELPIAVVEVPALPAETVRSISADSAPCEQPRRPVPQAETADVIVIPNPALEKNDTERYPY